MTTPTVAQATQKPKFASVWVLGSLAYVDRKTLSSALSELLYLLMWSTLPFWLGGLVGYVTSDAQDKSGLAITVATFRNGELLVFTLSMLAPTLFLMLHDPERARRFPHRLPLSTIGVLTALVCSALFALLKSNTIKDARFVFSLSLYLSSLALLLRYLSMVYHRFRLPELTEESLRASEKSFVDDFQRHVEGRE